MISLPARSIYLVLWLCLLLPGAAHAQILPDQASGATLEVQPRFPEPGETVTVQLSDFAIANQVNQIDWFVDGVREPLATNERSLDLTAGAIGETTTVEARMRLASGQPRVAATSFAPSRVLVTIEPETTAPSWYPGRSMPAVGSTIRAVAIPQTGSGQPASAYSYSWRVNDTLSNRGAIPGRFVERFTVPFGQGTTLSVEVTDQQGTLVARRSVYVPSVEPEVYFYTTNSLRGQQPLALTGITPMIGDEMTVRAETYHIAPTTDASTMFYEWEVNGRTVQNPSRDPQTITVQRGEGTGRFTIGFQIQNLNALLQGVTSDFTLTF